MPICSPSAHCLWIGVLENFARAGRNVGHNQEKRSGRSPRCCPGVATWRIGRGNTELRKFRSRGTRLRFWSPLFQQPGTQRFRPLPRCGDEPVSESGLCLRSARPTRDASYVLDETRIVGAGHAARRVQTAVRSPSSSACSSSACSDLRPTQSQPVTRTVAASHVTRLASIAGIGERRLVFIDVL